MRGRGVRTDRERRVKLREGASQASWTSGVNEDAEWFNRDKGEKPLEVNQNLTVLWEGACDSPPTCPKVCSADYKPVCAKDCNNHMLTFSNLCMLESYNCCHENSKIGGFHKVSTSHVWYRLDQHFVASADVEFPPGLKVSTSHVWYRLDQHFVASADVEFPPGLEVSTSHVWYRLDQHFVTSADVGFPPLLEVSTSHVWYRLDQHFVASADVGFPPRLEVSISHVGYRLDQHFVASALFPQQQSPECRESTQHCGTGPLTIY
uniref:Kazal-like domain-containing protein n=1 Tax=Timema douglasi TaxID=61478 RepID=A0A7R8ZD14_TIMDO|nr:unnamed protein product [Timema douglasi]